MDNEIMTPTERLAQIKEVTWRNKPDEISDALTFLISRVETLEKIRFHAGLFRSVCPEYKTGECICHKFTEICNAFLVKEIEGKSDEA